MTKFMPFVYDKHQFYTNQKCFIVTGNCLGYLTAFLNSKIFRFTFKEFFPELLGDTRELSKIFFDKISILEISELLNVRFDELVEAIQKNRANGISNLELELEVEDLLCSVYSISAEERALIDSRESPAAAIDSSITELSDALSS